MNEYKQVKIIIKYSVDEAITKWFCQCKRKSMKPSCLEVSMICIRRSEPGFRSYCFPALKDTRYRPMTGYSIVR